MPRAQSRERGGPGGIRRAAGAGVATSAAAAAAVGVCLVSLGGYLTLSTLGSGKPQAVLAVLFVIFVYFATASLYRPRLALGVRTVGRDRAAHASVRACHPSRAGLDGRDAVVARRRARATKRRRQAVLPAAIPPFLVMLAIAPTLYRIVAGSRCRPSPAASASLGGRGMFAAAFDALHLADLANILMIYVPALACSPFALPPRRPSGDGRSRADRLLLWVLVILVPAHSAFIHPFRRLPRPRRVPSAGSGGRAAARPRDGVRARRTPLAALDRDGGGRDHDSFVGAMARPFQRFASGTPPRDGVRDRIASSPGG